MDDGRITFDRWLAVAKEELKWNDGCIKLLWDNIHVCTHRMTEYWSMYTDSISFEFIAIFLVLHAIDDPQASPKLPYDTAWPEDMNEPSAVPSSPTNKGSSAASGGFGGRPSMNLPKSPRSPHSSSDAKYSTYNKFIKRAREDPFDIDGAADKKSSYQNRLAKHASHSLNAIRAKIPFILKALSSEFASEEDLATASEYSPSDFSGEDLMISRRGVNAL